MDLSILTLYAVAFWMLWQEQEQEDRRRRERERQQREAGRTWRS
jgi:hypothetical protein